MTDVFTEVENDLTIAQKVIPTLSPFLSLIPGFSQIIAYFQLIPVLINAVQTVQQINGGSKAAAVAAVTDHLTPGAPNSTALAGTALGASAPAS